MSLITWNPNDCSGCVLSNNNLTFQNTVTDGWARATVGKTQGKWYWEVTMHGVSGWCGTGIAPRLVLNQWSSLHYLYQNPVRNLQAGDVIGIFLDMDNKTVQFSRNGQLVTEIISINTDEAMYPCIWGGYRGCIATVNFGATEFHIVTSNPNVWQELVRQGYLPYDVENASWFGFYTTDPQIVKTTAASQINTQGYKGINQITVVDNITEEDKYTEQLNMTLQTQLEQGNIFTVTVDKTTYRKIFDLFVV